MEANMTLNQYIIFTIISLSIVFLLLRLLQKIINQQIEKEVKVFTKKAKIPNFLSDAISIKLKFK